MKSTLDQSRLVHAKKLVATEGISQQELAKAVSASQSQVSRALAGKSPKRSQVAKRIIAYLNGFDRMTTLADVRRQPKLIAAVADIWDGSEEHAIALEHVIRSLGALSTPLVRRARKRQVDFGS